MVNLDSVPSEKWQSLQCCGDETGVRGLAQCLSCFVAGKHDLGLDTYPIIIASHS